MKRFLILTLLPALLCADMLTPAYYSGELKKQADVFLAACHQVKMHHPLENKKGRTPDYIVPNFGKFGAGKGPTQTEQHHPATDLKVEGGETDVELYAAHDGVIFTVRDAPKYRHYISISKIITDEKGNELGKLVTLYGHVDLDLDEKDGLKLDGKQIKAGEGNALIELPFDEMGDGYHEVRLIAQAALPVTPGGFKDIPVFINKKGRSIAMTGMTDDLPGKITITAKPEGEETPTSVYLLWNGRKLVSAAPGENLTFDEKVIGEGPHRIQAVAVYEDGMEVRSEPQGFSIAFNPADQ